MSRQILFVIAAAAIAACESWTDVETGYRAELNGASVVPPSTSTGSGSFSARLGPSNLMTYELTFAGLSGNATDAHIHGPATATDSAGILVNLDDFDAGRLLSIGSPSGTGSGTLLLSPGLAITPTVTADSLVKLLDAGRLYVDVHVGLAPRGEIRGQLRRR